MYQLKNNWSLARRLVAYVRGRTAIIVDLATRQRLSTCTVTTLAMGHRRDRREMRADHNPRA